MISFVTCIKILPSYSDIADRLQVYVDCVHQGCSALGIIYEIIVVEDICSKNMKLLRSVVDEDWCKERNVRHIPYEATYANPHGFPLIEAFAKNHGIRAAVYPYVCVTNCDLAFNRGFFEFLASPALRPQTFYRFLQYEIPAPPVWRWSDVEPLLETPRFCFNGKLQQLGSCTLEHISYKSGDIMLLDAAIWSQVQGFPENEVWVHSDFIVCQVVSNNGIPLSGPSNAFVYTYPQHRPESTNDVAKVYENKAAEYLTRTSCNFLNIKA